MKKYNTFEEVLDYSEQYMKKKLKQISTNSNRPIKGIDFIAAEIIISLSDNGLVKDYKKKFTEIEMNVLRNMIKDYLKTYNLEINFNYLDCKNSDDFSRVPSIKRIEKLTSDITEDFAEFYNSLK